MGKTFLCLHSPLLNGEPNICEKWYCFHFFNIHASDSNESVTNLRCVSITFYGAVSPTSTAATTTQNTYTEICACEMNAMHSFRMTFERLQAVMNFQLPVIGRCDGFEMNLCLQWMNRLFLLPHTRSTAIAILNNNGHYLLIFFRLRFYVTRTNRQEIRKCS